ncbi:MAG: response regulator transcription factor [Bacteroidales bacterium]|nr:response regulator transcription factor [Bacteroidales bacterium]MCL2739428.1 response regulator transcription factor [Bacteroidales bacterium]
MRQILIVEDEADICEILKFNLENEGYEVSVAYSAEEAIMLNLPCFHLLLVDVMMDKMSGFEFAQIVRKNSHTKHIPIIFLTAKSAEQDVLTGFKAGADDYIYKPFSIRIVLARIQAVLQRHDFEDKLDDLHFESLHLYPRQKKAMVGAHEADLTKKEFEMLLLFMRHSGKVFSREEILHHVWSDQVCVTDRTIDVHINRLRKKIEPYGDNIVTRSGYGYCFEG